MPSQTPEQALLVTRILWGALLTVPLILLGVFASKIFSTEPRPQTAEGLMKIFPLIAGVLALIELLALYFVRSIIYKMQRENDVVTPQGFLTGNLIFFAGCEGLMMFVVVCCMLTQSALPTGLPGLAALAVMLINFPTGRAMFPDGALPNPYNPDAQ